MAMLKEGSWRKKIEGKENEQTERNE